MLDELTPNHFGIASAMGLGLTFLTLLIGGLSHIGLAFAALTSLGSIAAFLEFRLRSRPVQDPAQLLAGLPAQLALSQSTDGPSSTKAGEDSLPTARLEGATLDGASLAGMNFTGAA
ncbi:MAG: hypothetical protein AAGI01_18290, partial [Myxococcota bacterium]